jgi:hypothetical protein
LLVDGALLQAGGDELETRPGPRHGRRQRAG